MACRDRVRSLLPLFGWLAGAGVLVLLVSRVGWRRVEEAFAHVGANLLWLLAAYAAGTILAGLPWRQLMPRETRPSIAGAVLSRFCAAGLNAVLPLLSLGEVSRLRWLPRSAWGEGIAAMVVDRLLFMLASAVNLAVGAIAVALLPSLPARFAAVAAATAILVVAIVAALVWIALTRAPAARLRRTIERLRGQAARLDTSGAAPATTPSHVDEALSRLLRGNRSRLVTAAAVHVAGRALLAVEIYAGLRALGHAVGPLEVAALSAVPVALSTLGAVVPSQIGLQEGAQGAVTAALGLGATAGLLLVLLQRARQAVFVPLAALLLSVGPGRFRRPNASPARHGASRPQPNSALPR